MNEYTADLWKRAGRALATAQTALDVGDNDTAASRAYYAALYAVSAMLSLRGLTFKKHSAVESALHRELVHGGSLSTSVGTAYRSLVDLRNTGDYGGLEHVTSEQGREALLFADMIMRAVGEACPELGVEAQGR